MGGVMSEYGDLSRHAVQHWARAMFDAADRLAARDKLYMYSRISGSMHGECSPHEMQSCFSTLVPQRRYSELL